MGGEGGELVAITEGLWIYLRSFAAQIMGTILYSVIIGLCI